ncbi:hypothetical protein ICE98_00853 [Lactococcus lactis]|nr:hypothetical protein [Lactococcus lactis]
MACYSVNVPYNFGNYYIEGSTTESGTYPKDDETLDVYYKYVPPIVYYNTSNPYATTYYANGYEYVPNYIAPVVYYAPTYGYYSYDGGTSYSGGYGYSSGGYSSSNGAYYPNYVPKSAYYSKETDLVAEDNYSSSTPKKKSSGGVLGWLSNQWNLAMESEKHFDWGSTSSTLTTLFVFWSCKCPGDAAGVDETYVKSYGGQ